MRTNIKVINNGGYPMKLWVSSSIKKFVKNTIELDKIKYEVGVVAMDYYMSTEEWKNRIGPVGMCGLDLSKPVEQYPESFLTLLISFALKPSFTKNFMDQFETYCSEILITNGGNNTMGHYMIQPINIYNPLHIYQTKEYNEKRELISDVLSNSKMDSEELFFKINKLLRKSGYVLETDELHPDLNLIETIHNGKLVGIASYSVTLKILSIDLERNTETLCKIFGLCSAHLI